MKTIITHHNPDLDAVTSVWMIKKFLPNWQDAVIEFVPAGETWNDELVDSKQDVIHVDTGLGRLDHHQVDDRTCAAKLTYEFIKTQIDKTGKWQDEALERMCEVVCIYDHFEQVKLADILADYHEFSAERILDGLKAIYHDNDQKIISLGIEVIEAIYKSFKDKIWAEDIIATEGVHFQTKWGKGIGFETVNDDVVKHAQKSGYILAVRKDPKKGYIRIKAVPGTEVDLTGAYQRLKQTDPEATWYLHPSKKILLNGTTKNPHMKPTKLSLNDIIKVIENS